MTDRINDYFVILDKILAILYPILVAILLLIVSLLAMLILYYKQEEKIVELNNRINLLEKSCYWNSRQIQKLSQKENPRITKTN